LLELFKRLCTAKKEEDFKFPVSRLDDMLSRPDVHLSTVPSVRTTCSSRPDARQTSIIRPDDVSFRPDPTLCREASVPACIRLDLSASRPDVHQCSTSFRFFPSSDMIRLTHRPDNVVSCPDALIHKARIAIQISPSGRQSALVRTRMQLIWKLPIRLQPSERLHLMVQTHA
jgi:hypothetical protein